MHRRDLHIRTRQRREAEVQSLKPGAPMPGFPAAVAGFTAALETYDSPPPVSRAEAEAVFGVRLTTLESFITQLSSVEAQPGI